MKPISELYKTSTDYERLVELLLFKGDVICIEQHERLLTASYNNKLFLLDNWYYPLKTKNDFIELCNRLDLRFIDPNGE